MKPHEYGRDERVPSGVTISDSGCADSKSDASEQSREKDTSICGDLDRGGMDQQMIDAYASAKLSYTMYLILFLKSLAREWGGGHCKHFSS